MPYASYALLTDEDVKALYAYFTKTVPAVDEPPAKTTSLPFPYSMRFSMAFWNALFLDAKPFRSDVARSPEWNRADILPTVWRIAASVIRLAASLCSRIAAVNSPAGDRSLGCAQYHA
jgi:hypothetical protein